MLNPRQTVDGLATIHILTVVTIKIDTLFGTSDLIVVLKRLQVNHTGAQNAAVGAIFSLAVVGV